MLSIGDIWDAVSRDVGFWNLGYLEYGMFMIWDVRNVGCSGYEMFRMWDLGCS